MIDLCRSDDSVYREVNERFVDYGQVPQRGDRSALRVPAHNNLLHPVGGGRAGERGRDGLRECKRRAEANHKNFDCLPTLVPLSSLLIFATEDSLQNRDGELDCGGGGVVLPIGVVGCDPGACIADHGETARATPRDNVRRHAAVTAPP